MKKLIPTNEISALTKLFSAKKSQKIISNLLNIATVVFFLLALITSPASALEIVPFDSSNQSPLIQIYGLPGVGNYRILAPGQTEVGMNAVLSNNFAVDSKPRENVTLDGETSRFTLLARHAFFSRLELGVRIPYVHHGGGFLDSFLDDYHRSFGFPRGGREQAPRNRLLYLYQRNGADVFRLANSASGLGDIMLTTAWQLYRTTSEKEDQALAMNLGLKLPTGDSDELLGSGSADISLWLNGGIDNITEMGTLTTYGALGMLAMTKGDILEEQQNNWVAFGSLGVGWAPWRWLAFKVQADAHTAFFNDSDLDAISANSLQLIIGGTLGFTESTALDIGVSEDVIVETSPDVAFYLTLRTRF